MRDGEARRAVGVSKLRLSQLLGVDRKTLDVYETMPERVGHVRRAAFGFVYGAMRLLGDAIALARRVIRREDR